MKNALSRLAGTLATLSALPWQAAHAASAADLQKCGILAGAVGNNSKDCQEALRSAPCFFSITFRGRRHKPAAPEAYSSRFFIALAAVRPNTGSA